MLGNPCKKGYKGMVRANLIPNCESHLLMSLMQDTSLGQTLRAYMEKMVLWSPTPVVADYVVVHCQRVEASTRVMLEADVFFVDGTALLMTESWRIKFVTAEHMLVRMGISLSKQLKHVLLVYSCAGFRVRTILMDCDFEKIKTLLPTIECNTTAAKRACEQGRMHDLDNKGAHAKSDC
jgi:hypothetical protein